MIIRGKDVNMITIFCFLDKVTFILKNRYLRFFNNYKNFIKGEKTKQRIKLIISIQKVMFTKSSLKTLKKTFNNISIKKITFNNTIIQETI